MDTVISVNQFRDNLKAVVERAIDDHTPITVTRRGAQNFVVISEQDWQSLEETLYVLQNKSLISQIQQSSMTHNHSLGYQPSPADLDDILCED